MAEPTVKALEDINRTLKELLQNQRDQLRAQKAINHNLIALFSKEGQVVEDAPPEPDEASESADPVYTPKEYGWSMAALAQREGVLVKGDIKNEQDESRWVWNGEAWERVEEPSAREPD